MNSINNVIHTKYCHIKIERNNKEKTSKHPSKIHSFIRGENLDESVKDVIWMKNVRLSFIPILIIHNWHNILIIIFWINYHFALLFRFLVWVSIFILLLGQIRVCLCKFWFYRTVCSSFKQFMNSWQKRFWLFNR